MESLLTENKSKKVESLFHSEILMEILDRGTSWKLQQLH
jgi:hypothetical protein